MCCTVCTILAAFSQARVVTVPAGPLIRVEGQTVSIRCDVSDYEGPREQDFEWKLLQNGNSLGLVSTFDSSFPHSSFKDRVNSDSSVVGNYDTVKRVVRRNQCCSSELIENRLKVVPVAAPGVVLEGNPLELLCNATRDPVTSTYLSVTWSIRKGSLSPQEILTFGPDGQVTADAGSALRYANKGLQLDMRRSGTYGLILTEVLPSDQGTYTCTAREWALDGGRVWQKILETTVVLGDVEVTLIVNLGDLVVPQFSGNPMELECRVVNISHLKEGRLGVSWMYTKVTPADLPTSTQVIGTLDQHGDLMPGSAYQQRIEKGLIVLSKVKPDAFKLRFLQMRDTDMGSYSCNVSTWTHTQDGAWLKAKEVHSSDRTIRWTPKNPTLSVNAKSVRVADSSGSTFEMSCQVTGENLQEPGYSILIRKETASGEITKQIVSLSQDSVLKLERQDEPDGVMLDKTGPGQFRFRLYGAQISDNGLYFCDATAWTRDAGNSWVKAVSAESNRIPVAFTVSGPSFNISVRLDSTPIYRGETATVECVLTAQGAVSYDVQWFLTPLHGFDSSFLLASINRWGVVNRNPHNGSSTCSLERVDAGTFRLSIHQASNTDAGDYYCKATPWVQSSTGTWTKGLDIISDKILLVEEWSDDSLKLPLLSGIGASLAVGLFAILTGYIFAWCCYRSSSQDVRSRNRLMDIEMD
uniref:Prostaglandin F2 receptor inhibitor n=1 Tax=Scleropages formosus TaxID=113540 RepID=A0A8C9RK03_SCLFO